MTENHRWLVAAVGGLTVVATAAALPPAASASVLIALQLAVVAAVYRGVARIDAPSRLGGWFLLASCSIGLLASALIALPPHLAAAAWPIVAVARQSTFVLGLASIVGVRRWLRGGQHSLDAGIIAVGVTVCAWAFVIQPRFGAYPPLPSQYSVGRTFAALDFLLIWTLARILTSASFRTPPMLLLAAGGVSLLTANLLANTNVGRYGFREFQPGGSVYLVWQACGVLVAAAALHPRASDRCTRPPESIERIPRWRFVSLVSVAMLTPVIPVVQLSLVAHLIPDEALVPLVGLSVLTCLLLLLLVVRLGQAVRLEARRADAMNHQSAVMATQTETLRRTLDNQHALQTELAWRATHDPLTRVGNRALLAERLWDILNHSAYPNGALLLVDLDEFKAINDSLGHPAGDRLLIQVGQRLTSTSRGSDNVARLGGDEFALLIEDCAPRDCREIARTVLDNLRATYVEGERHHQLTASVGLVILGQDGRDAANVLRDADLAMYAAKRAGGNQVVEFSLDMRVAHEMHTELAAGVRTAIAENRLRVAYQPIVDITSGRTVAVEALLRWRAVSGRSFSPGEFIAVAEDIGLVGDVGAEVLDTAIADVAAWSIAHSMFVSVNVSGRQLMSASFASEVLRTLGRHAVSPARLVLEITETVLINASGGTAVSAMRNLDELRRHGVRIAVDDFGTGYSSLAYLQQLPIDILKVDRMFTSALDDPDERNVRFVGAILNLGASLGVPVVAEGVESARQAKLLEQLGCPFAQGFYFAKPCSSEQVIDYFTADRPAPR